MKKIKKIILYVFSILPFFKRVYQTRDTSAPIKLSYLFNQFILRKNTSHWPIHPSSLVTGIDYIKIGIGSAPGFSFGNYIFATKDAPIYFGDYTILAPNVCIAGVNHNIYDYRKYISKGKVSIGSYCWIGVNSTILPGIELGDHTIVSANSVVTKSFPNGYVIIGGNPAKEIKMIEKEKCINFRNKYEYYGYIPKENYEKGLL